MITLKYFYGTKRLKHALVYLEGKLVGKIVQKRDPAIQNVNGVWAETYQYFPKTSSRKYGEGGEVFLSFRSCLDSLEAE